VITQPPVLGAPDWRDTNSVIFLLPGLYPLELLYAQIAENAAMEFSWFMGSFNDSSVPANEVPVYSLNTIGFKLISSNNLFLTEDGSKPIVCQQCNRETAQGCSSGYFCNSAALCEPCKYVSHCGYNCTSCTYETGQIPLCVQIGNNTYQCQVMSIMSAESSSIQTSQTLNFLHSSSPRGLSGGIIALIVILPVCCCFLIIIVAAIFIRRRMKLSKIPSQ